MSEKSLKTPRSVYAILAAGIVLGAVGAFAVLRGPVVPKAIAGPSPQKLVGNLTVENTEALHNLNDSFANLAEYIAPAVVAIRVESSRSTDMMGRRMPSQMGEGSGVVIRKDGWILTNDHVVGGFDKVTVVLSDGREFAGKVTRSDYSDIAVVKIEANELPTVEFADSNKVRPGQFAIAVGSPFGLENSVTIGHVSALGRQSEIADPNLALGARSYPDLIQTDAAINRGNSGGPLLDVDGRVIGINTAIYGGAAGSVGVGFAIPANQAKFTANMLIEKGKIVRGYLGMAPANVKPFRQKELGITGGALVEQFAEEGYKSPAKEAGLKVGDVIVRIGDITVTGQQDVRNAMLVYGPGESVTIEFVRGKDRKTVDVKLMDATKEQVIPMQKSQTPKNEQLPRGNQGTPNIPELNFPDLFGNGESEEVVPPIREGQAKLGVMIEPVGAANRKEFGIPAGATGVVVRSVQDGSVAARIGLKPGDVISRVGNTDIKSEADLKKAMGGVKWGDSKQIRFSRFTANGHMTRDVPVKF